MSVTLAIDTEAVSEGERQATFWQIHLKLISISPPLYGSWWVLYSLVIQVACAYGDADVSGNNIGGTNDR
jgi:hypothetical protein